MAIKNEFDLWLATEHKTAHESARRLMMVARAALGEITIDGPASDEDAVKLKQMTIDLRLMAGLCEAKAYERNAEIQKWINRHD